MKRTLQAAIAASLVLAGIALWAGQQPAAAPGAAEVEHRVEQYLRNYYAWGKAFTVTASAPASSPLPGVYSVPVAVSYQNQSEKVVVYVSHDGKYMFTGLSNMLVDPFASLRQRLEAAIDGHPYVGPAKACVNVVEFSDYECPYCRQVQLLLNQLEPQFPQVRFTFVNFPLTQIHPWAMDAALASRCAFEKKPAVFNELRNAIYDNQTQLTADNASASLAKLLTQAGLDPNSIQACMKTPAAQKAVQDDIGLGRSLGVDATPTLFINGRRVVGGNEGQMEQMIGYEQEKCGGAGHPGPGKN